MFATIGFMTLVGKWNDYTTSMIYIRDTSLYTLQYLLQRILMEIEFIKSMMSGDSTMGTANLNVTGMRLPAETMKYAMCVIAAGPMLFIFPFFQKYFSQGLTIGAVKG